MRSVSSILAAASLVGLTFAWPDSLFSPIQKRDSTCMSQAEAQQVADNFHGLIANYSNSAADAVLTVGFTDYSDSVTSLIDSGCTGPAPLGEATFNSRASFESGQGSQADIPFEQLNVWYNCDTVFLRWRTTLSADPAPQFVTGIIVLETTSNPASTVQPWLINTVYSEFNSGAWLVDLGVFKPNCSATPASHRLLRG